MDDLLRIITSVDYEDYGSLQLIEISQREGDLDESYVIAEAFTASPI